MIAKVEQGETVGAVLAVQRATETVTQSLSGLHVPEYVAPIALDSRDEVTWHEDASPVGNYVKLGRALSRAGDLFRNTVHGEGLVQTPSGPSSLPKVINSQAGLAAVVVDRVRVKIVAGGKSKGSRLPGGHLATMLACEAFLQQFPPLDMVTTSPMYTRDFQLTVPGYNDGGLRQRVFYVGVPGAVVRTTDTIRRFLDVMAFATESDRANAVAFALTRVLRSHFHGGKPVVIVTASKSHAGKETIVQFASGISQGVSVSYQSTDWALERTFVGAVRTNPDVAVINVENARLTRGVGFIRSAFLERFITDPNPMLYSTGTGAPVRRANDLVVVITTNYGVLSADLMNRGMHIHLEPTGNIEDRISPIGNPKEEFLPAHRATIDAELRGMIERWKDAGRPLDSSVKHPFTAWAQTVGGILMINEFKGFLANYSTRKAVDDPVRRALGLLGADHPAEGNVGWEGPGHWAQRAVHLGLVKTLIAEGDRDTERGRERSMGVVLKAHEGETFEGETENRKLTLCLERARRRFVVGEEPSTRYRFRVVRSDEIPEDAEITP